MHEPLGAAQRNAHRFRANALDCASLNGRAAHWSSASLGERFETAGKAFCCLLTPPLYRNSNGFLCLRRRYKRQSACCLLSIVPCLFGILMPCVSADAGATLCIMGLLTVNTRCSTLFLRIDLHFSVSPIRLAPLFGIDSNSSLSVRCLAPNFRTKPPTRTIPSAFEK